MMTTLRRLAMMAVLALGSPAWAATKMTNQDVIDMVQAKMNEATIVKAIEAGEPGFDTSAKALIKLSAAKVPEAVVQAMLDAGKGPSVANAGKSSAPSGTIGPEEVLLIEGDRQSAMHYVTPQTRTASRGLGYGGIAMYAVLSGPQATLRTATNQPTFLMAIPSNVQPESYFTLVSLAARKNDTREVMISSVTFASTKSGITKDRILPTQIEKDPDQTRAREGFTIYRISPASPLPKGEYSMVLSNTQAKVASGLDSYFDFGVDG